MVMKRWEQLYVELQRKAEKLGYGPPRQVGSDTSQTFEFRINRKPVMLIAFRDLGLKPGYARPNRLWAEGLDLVLKRYLEIGKTTPDAELPTAIAIVIDNIGDSYIVVLIDDLLRLYRERIKRRHVAKGRHLTFVVERRDEEYYLVMPEESPPVPLLNVDSMNAVVELLRSLRTDA